MLSDDLVGLENGSNIMQQQTHGSMRGPAGSLHSGPGRPADDAGPLTLLSAAQHGRSSCQAHAAEGPASASTQAVPVIMNGNGTHSHPPHLQQRWRPSSSAETAIKGVEQWVPNKRPTPHPRVRLDPATAQATQATQQQSQQPSQTARVSTRHPAGQPAQGRAPPQPFSHSHSQGRPHGPGRRQSPGDFQASYRLSQQIKACSDWWQLRALLVVQEHCALNGVHVAAALTRVARVAPSPVTQQPQERTALAAFVDGSLLEAARRTLPCMGPREACTVVHALGTLEHAPRLSWLAAFLPGLAALLPAFSARDAASCVWGLSRVVQALEARGRLDPATAALLADFTTRLLSRAGELLSSSNPQDLANVVLGSSRLAGLLAPGGDSSQQGRGAGSTAWWVAWRETLLAATVGLHQHSCSPQALANIAHGLAHMPGPHPSPAWRSAFERAAEPQLALCRPQALAALAGATPRLGWAPGEWWPAAVLQAAQRQLREFGAADLVDVVLSAHCLLPTPGGGRGSREGVEAWLQGLAEAMENR